MVHIIWNIKVSGFWNGCWC